MYATPELAKQAIEDTVDKRDKRQYRDHGYVYALNNEYGVLFHPEDRYLMTFLPDNAKIMWHATFSGYPESIAWEQRSSNASQDDIDVLRDAGLGNIASLLLGLDDEE